jgi:hypothetical protein
LTHPLAVQAVPDVGAAGTQHRISLGDDSPGSRTRGAQDFALLAEFIPGESLAGHGLPEYDSP